MVSTIGIQPKGVKSTTHMLTSVDAPLFTQPNLEQFWDLESLGISESPTRSSYISLQQKCAACRCSYVAMEREVTRTTPELLVGSGPPEINVTEIVEISKTS